jgi:hypothetical protein
MEESPGGGLDEGGRSDGGRGRPDPTRLLLALFGAAARARRSSAEPYSADYAPRRRRGGGCLGRLIMLAVLLFLLFLMVPVFLGALLGFG